MTNFFVIVINCFVLFSVVEAARSDGNPDISAVVEANNKFAVDLFKICAKEAKGKLFLSPFSVTMALAMIHSGAAGNTKNQLQEAMYLTGFHDVSLHKMFSHLLKEVEKSDEYGTVTRLFLANGLFAEKSFKFLPDFLKTLRIYYDAEAQNVDFTNDAAGAERLINNWVEEKTQNKIKDIIPPNTLDWMTRLVIVNTLYFRSDWESKFDKLDTRDGRFHSSNGKAFKIRFMVKSFYVSHGTNKEIMCDFLQLPYSDKSLFMNIYLPYSNSNIDNLERNLKFEHISDEDNMFAFRKRYIELYLPRFKVKSTFNLNHVLGALGMPDLFDRADLSKMDRHRRLSVSDVMHKAFIDVNEDGTEASAASAASLSIRMSHPTVKVNRPFIFVIKHSSTNSVLFMGKYDI